MRFTRGLRLEPVPVQPAVAAVAIAARLLFAMLLPEQLERQVFVGLYLPPHGGEVRFVGFAPVHTGIGCGEKGRGKAILFPAGDVWPLQSGFRRLSQELRNGGLANLATQRNLALTQPQGGQPQDCFDLLHGQPFLRQLESSTLRVESGQPLDCPAPASRRVPKPRQN